MSSIRYQILDAVKTALEAITIANGYSMDVQKVTRRIAPADTEGVYPVIYIAEPPSDKDEGVDENKTHVALRLRIECWIEDGIEGSNTDATRALRDVEHALTQDTTFGGLAIDFTVGGNEMAIVDRPRLIGIAVDGRVHFSHSRSSPQAA